MNNNLIKTYIEPIFDETTGYLITGVHEISINDLLKHEVLAGTQERIKLINSLKLACETYWSFDITGIYANGSFATSKPVPKDIDGYLQVSFESDNYLELLQSDSIWGNFKGKDRPNDKFPMWYVHKIEFYLYDPKYINPNFNPPNFFTHSREGIERGILKIIQ
jgi:hypothetical protein